MRVLPRVLIGLWLAVVPCCGVVWCATAFAEDDSAAASASAAGTISGTVTDQEGALVPGATVTVARTGLAPVTVTADEMGRFTVAGLAPGRYTVAAAAPGFSKASKALVVAAGKLQQVTLALTIEVQQQQVEVSGNETDASPENNGSAIVIKGAALDSLSEDSDEMTQQLQAIAGSDPESGTQFYVDGFTAGKLPPKSSIREIRINQNPYSAQYDQLGYGRIEIFTKPGTDKLHGDLWMRGNDSAWNAQNPFVTFQPSYHLFLFDGDLNGPINKKTSFFMGAYGQNSVNEAIVNAVILNPATLQPESFTQSVSTPTTELNLAPRVDWQWGERQTISLRYQLGRNTQTNSGVGQFALASQGLNLDNTEQVLQFSDTQTYGAHVVNETRFQYMRDRNNTTPVSTDVAVNVQGGFTSGGNAAGLTKDNQDHYEFQDYLQMDVGKHDLNMGGRLRGVRDANNSTANFNGQFTFASVAAYQITEQGLQQGLSGAQIRAEGGGASQYIQSFGKSGVVASMLDVGLYGEDNWKVTKDVTLSYGLRFESQTQIHDHADFAPRVGVAWAIPGAKNKPPRAVIRAGYGWFYQRFQSGNILQAERQNGVTQTEAVVNNPDFFPGTCSGLSGNCATSSAGSPTIYQINPELRSPYTMMGGIGIDKPIGKYVSMSATYMWSRGEHLFLTRNINAPLPGTYDPNDPESGTRPLGTDENIYEYESEGASGRNRLSVNGNLHTMHAGIFGYYMLSKAEANTAGVGTFPSNGYDLHADYGRASYDYRQRLFLGGFTRLPWRFGINPFIVYQSGAPFNITVGQDLNGDTIFNDRPAFATDLSRPSVYATKWGTFDAEPIAGQKIIPINYGRGPGLFIANLRVNRTFNFGPVVPDDNPPAPTPAKDAKAPAKPVKKEIQRKYTLGFAVASNNVLNHRNLAAPVGVLGSPLFGQSTSLSSMFGAGSPDRTVNIETFFEF